ncbi:MAG: hydroxylamine oxidase [bacterium]|nr:MAG: hydroxylamine oxidase [bacterium]
MRIIILTFVILLIAITQRIDAQEQNRSEKTEMCIDCHVNINPGIVQDWLKSRHAKISPAIAIQKSKLERRVSNENIPQELANSVVGCYECHALNTNKHKDSFEHYDIQINVIVSPNDCKTCHLVEVEQYSGSTKAHAVGNLSQNPIYNLLAETIISPKKVIDNQIIQEKVSHMTERETCYGCHGTQIEVNGLKTIVTEDEELQVPDLSGWPNQGVGRINPDGSMGACTSCHPRHAFSLKDARKPYTCGQCHLEPDVPAYNVYKESKHGNIFSARGSEWQFEDVPWVVGQNFLAPTCAVCHNSLITDPDGNVIADRTHNFDSRIWERIFGLIYSHPQPKHGATHTIKNADELPLPTTFNNQPATAYLINDDEIKVRRGKMKKVCKACHSTDWVDKHFEKFHNTIKETNQMILAATQLVKKSWQRGLADNKNPFDEEIEILWIQPWLFYANSIRYSSAMTGAPDYAAFKLGWWELSKSLQAIKNWIDFREREKND